MLSLEPEKVMAEVRAQEKARDKHLAGAADLIEKYPGPCWQDGSIDASQSIDAENASFEFLSYEMTQHAWSNPRWRFNTRRPRAQQMVARALQSGMNQWTTDSDLQTTIEDLVVDFSFAWAVTHATLEPAPESYEAEDPPLYPQLSRISPWDFGMDHRAPSFRRARMLWHRSFIDKEDLIERARLDRARPKQKREGWVLSAIRNLQTSSPAETRGSNWIGRARQAMKRQTDLDEETPDRDQVAMIEVFFPGLLQSGDPGPEDGFNGTVVTYGISGGGDGTPAVIRPPRPFYGPRWGPYTLIGCYIVPDNPWPLSALAAPAAQIEQGRRIANAVDAQVAAYKRLGITNDPTLAKLIKDSPNDTIHVYRESLSLDAGFVEREIGGTTAANVAAEQRVLARRDRMLGFSENQRGNTTGDTATDITYANAGAEARQGFRKARFRRGIRQSGKTISWYLYHTDEVIFPLSEPAEVFGGTDEDEAWFIGGEEGDGSGHSFDDLGLDIEVGSMERPNDGAMRARGEALMNLLPMIVQAGPALAQMGGDLKGIIDAMGESFGYPDASRLFPGLQSVDVASMQPAEIGPMLGRQAGAAGVLRSLGAAAPGARGTSRGSPMPAEFGMGQTA